MFNGASSVSHLTASRRRCAVAELRDTGLERGEALAADLEWFERERGVVRHPSSAGGAPGIPPGANYVELLADLAETDVPAFICHYYNVYFAHTAGGMMIGRSVSNAILDGAELQFYKYGDADLDKLKDGVRARIERLASEWSDDDVARSVAQTRAAFSNAGAIMRCITQACDCDCRREL